MADDSPDMGLPADALLPFVDGLGILQKPHTVRWLDLKLGTSGHLQADWELERLLAVEEGRALVETIGGRRVSLWKDAKNVEAAPLGSLVGFTPEAGSYTAHGACIRLGTVLAGLDLEADGIVWKALSTAEPPCIVSPDGRHVAVAAESRLQILAADSGTSVDEVRLNGDIREFAVDSRWTCWWVRRADRSLVRLRKAAGGPWIQEQAGEARGTLAGCWEHAAVERQDGWLRLVTPESEVGIRVGAYEQAVVKGDVVALLQAGNVRLMKLSEALSASEKARLRRAR